MCSRSYLIADEVYFFAPDWSHGQVGGTVKIDLPLWHPDADYLEMQVLTCDGVDGRVNIHRTSDESDEQTFLAVAAPPTTVVGAQPPVGRLLNGVRALWLSTNTDEPRANSAIVVAVRLFGTAKGGCRG